jgi:hypothetical protein
MGSSSWLEDYTPGVPQNMSRITCVQKHGGGGAQLTQGCDQTMQGLPLGCLMQPLGVLLGCPLQLLSYKSQVLGFAHDCCCPHVYYPARPATAAQP